VVVTEDEDDVLRHVAARGCRAVGLGGGQARDGDQKDGSEREEDGGAARHGTERNGSRAMRKCALMITAGILKCERSVKRGDRILSTTEKTRLLISSFRARLPDQGNLFDVMRSNAGCNRSCACL
jgi:hypothetical protein